MNYKRKGGMGKRSFLIVSQETTQRPPKKLRAQKRIFALSAAPLKQIAHVCASADIEYQRKRKNQKEQQIISER